MADHPPRATESGTQRYRERFPDLPADHFRPRFGLQMSSIGLGTYLGGLDAATDRRYGEALAAALQRGCNVVDTGSSYRRMASKRAVGGRLAELFAAGEFDRDEVIVCTKGGLLAHDGQAPSRSRGELAAAVVTAGLAQPAEIAGGVHCLAPAFLSRQLDLSLVNLGLDAVDVFYLHEPNLQLAHVTPTVFLARLRAAFERLEAEAAAGRIGFYGVASWRGLTADTTDRDYLLLALLVKLAREVGGEQHRFRFIQFPYSLGATAALTKHNQMLDGAHRGAPRVQTSLLAAAVHYGIAAVTAASLRQTQVLGQVPPNVAQAFGLLASDAQLALQFARSTPGVTTALVGMRRTEHVAENLAVAAHPPLSPVEFFRRFPQRRVRTIQQES